MAANLYVGADNHTHEIDLDRVAKIASRDVEGFTITPARGYWHGQPEPSAVITVEADAAHIARLADDLKTELGLDAVGVQCMPEITFQDGGAR